MPQEPSGLVIDVRRQYCHELRGSCCSYSRYMDSAAAPETENHSHGVVRLWILVRIKPSRGRSCEQRLLSSFGPAARG